MLAFGAYKYLSEESPPKYTLTDMGKRNETMIGHAMKPMKLSVKIEALVG